MKLLRHGPSEHERPGLLDDKGGIRDLSNYVPDIDADCVQPPSLLKLVKLDPYTLPLVNGAPGLGTPAKGVGKCADHDLQLRGSHRLREPADDFAARTCVHLRRLEGDPLTKSLGRELAKTKIRVNCVTPRPVLRFAGPLECGRTTLRDGSTRFSRPSLQPGWITPHPIRIDAVPFDCGANPRVWNHGPNQPRAWLA
jgi:hypothetical protein